jgi:hypothetical protein
MNSWKSVVNVVRRLLESTPNVPAPPPLPLAAPGTMLSALMKRPRPYHLS